MLCGIHKHNCKAISLLSKDTGATSITENITNECSKFNKQAHICKNKNCVFFIDQNYTTKCLKKETVPKINNHNLVKIVINILTTSKGVKLFQNLAPTFKLNSLNRIINSISPPS